MQPTKEQLAEEFKKLEASLKSQEGDLATLVADVEYLKTYPPADEVALKEWHALRKRYEDAKIKFLATLLRAEEIARELDYQINYII